MPTASNVYYTSSTSAAVTCKVTSDTAPTTFILAKDNGQTDVNNWHKTMSKSFVYTVLTFAIFMVFSVCKYDAYCSR